MASDNVPSAIEYLRDVCNEPLFATEKSTSRFIRFNLNELEGELLDYVCTYLRKRNIDDVISCSLARIVTDRIISDAVLVKSLSVEQEDKKQLIDGSKVFNAAMEILKEAAKEWLENHKDFSLCPSKFLVSVDSIKNKRRKMEDRHVQLPNLDSLIDPSKVSSSHGFFAVYDGHGGVDAANYAANHLHVNLTKHILYESDLLNALKATINQTDESFVEKAKDEKLRSGTTAVVAVVTDTKLYIAWLGDSQAVLCKGGEYHQLMSPHKPDREDERKRIDELGGCVVWFGGWRVNGCLSVSRAIGDFEQKPFISGNPDVAEFNLEGDEDFLVLGCDGLWDVVNEEECVTMVQQYLNDGNDKNDTAKYLVNEAKNRASMDNITVVVVFFQTVANASKSNTPCETNNIDVKSPCENNYSITNNSVGNDNNVVNNSHESKFSVANTLCENDEKVKTNSHENQESVRNTSCENNVAKSSCENNVTKSSHDHASETPCESNATMTDNSCENNNHVSDETTINTVKD